MAEQEPLSIFGIILAGGSGTRFWPLSRSQYPKQVLRLLGSESMLQLTVERLLPLIPAAKIAVVTNAAQAQLVHQELHQKGWDEIRIWVEPQGRNTAAAVGLALVLPEDEPADQVMAVFPADHFIRDQESLLKALELGAAWARRGQLVTFGIPPTRPETGYGYIEQGAALDGDGQVFRVSRFIEKPPLDRARTFLDSGGYYWNSGIFVFRRDVLLAAFSRYLPELYQGLVRLRDQENPSSLEKVYQDLEAFAYQDLDWQDYVEIDP
ncbi:MAG: mannose-1-phosphate guanylyltransferase, partial [Syntrophales bacterium LBB04]|nr:mannose-1-phosphate guanylyltransferase [Syntrophales bacterium LBB04]